MDVPGIANPPAALAAQLEKPRITALSFSCSPPEQPDSIIAAASRTKNAFNAARLLQDAGRSFMPYPSTKRAAPYKNAPYAFKVSHNPAQIATAY
jgi:hypothetical protein